MTLPVESSETDHPPLATKIIGPYQVNGYALVFSRSDIQRLNVQLMDAQPRAIYVVSVRRGGDRVRIAWMKPNIRGRSEIVLDSRETAFPRLRAGDYIEIWQGRRKVAEGALSVQR